uniref:Glucagon / GIP / secretin / VIP family domain-containing protein n=1 Tax=Esox lucius TaxID=8010 RepID=A0AAY5KVK6_ESOLU
MMKRAVLLVIICLVMSASGSPYYPSIRFGQRDTSILMTSSIGQPIHLRRENNSALRQRAELRSGRHADAIFTNSYRKVLVMGLRPLIVIYNVKRKSDIYKDTYEQDLSPIQRKRLQRTAKQCQEAKVLSTQF